MSPPASPPSPASLRWVPTDENLAECSDDRRREVIERCARALAGLGARATPEAYAEAVAHGESAAVVRSYVPRGPVANWNASSCGLVTRRIWAACGVEGASLRPPYVPGSVMGALQAIARAAGAWRSPAVGTLPQLGDAIFRAAPGQHVCTVVAINGMEYQTVDGGQAGGWGGGTEITLRVRHLVSERGALWMAANGKRWPVLGWADVARLPFGGVVEVAEREAVA